MRQARHARARAGRARAARGALHLPAQLRVDGNVCRRNDRWPALRFRSRRRSDRGGRARGGRRGGARARRARRDARPRGRPGRRQSGEPDLCAPARAGRPRPAASIRSSTTCRPRRAKPNCSRWSRRSTPIRPCTAFSCNCRCRGTSIRRGSWKRSRRTRTSTAFIRSMSACCRSATRAARSSPARPRAR